jgi:DNA-binding IclR family transcriptional regulator
MGEGQAYPGTQAVLRAIRLLKRFSDAQPEMGLGDLARAAGLNKTTTFRLLTALESEGMVARGRRGDTYTLGPEAIALGGRALRANDLYSAGHAELEELAAASGETATLEVLAGGEVLILDEVPGSHVLSTIQYVGTRWPLQATSTGKVLLAHMDEKSRRPLLATAFQPYGPDAPALAGALEGELTTIAAQGYAVADEELEAGYIAFGAPIFDNHRHVVAAISIGGPLLRLPAGRRPEVIALVKAAAARISARLGYCR